MITDKKHFHIVGVCGVLTGGLALALKDAGHTVTGSDKGFYPPVSTHLSRMGVEYYAGFKVEKMIEKGVPDIVVAGTASGTSNPETLYALENKITIKSPVEIFREYFIKDKSIVCAGTWGKTTSSCLLSYIFSKAGLDPSYMFGGISLSQDLSSKIGESKISIFEGDEYKSSPTDTKPKFFYYSPTHLLLTSVSWDHADLYPTEKSYFEVFEKLVTNLPQKDGILVYCADDKGASKTADFAMCKKVSYALKPIQIDVLDDQPSKIDYYYCDIKNTKNGIEFTIYENKENNKKIKIKSSLIGSFNAENITACFIMAKNFGIKEEEITKYIENFKGIKRRFEKRLENKKVVLFDCHAPTAEKAKASLDEIKKIYSQEEIIAIYEPNIGGRERETLYKYDYCFSTADTVIIPRLTKLKIKEIEPIEGEELAKVISKTHQNTIYIEDDEKLVEFIVNKKDHKQFVIVFLGSHGFRNMIETVVEKLK